jgi:hypothetical protein
MHLYNCIWVVLLISTLNLAFLSPKLSCSIDIVLVCLCPHGFDNPRNTLRWKLLELTSVRLRIILFDLRSTNTNTLCVGAALHDTNWESYPSQMPLIPNPSTLDIHWKTYIMRVHMHVPILYSLWFDQEEGYIYKRTSRRALKWGLLDLMMDISEWVGRCIALKISTTSKAEYVSFPCA